MVQIMGKLSEVMASERVLCSLVSYAAPFCSVARASGATGSNPNIFIPHAKDQGIKRWIRYLGLEGGYFPSFPQNITCQGIKKYTESNMPVAPGYTLHQLGTLLFLYPS